MITLIVFVMMLIIDYINVLTKGNMGKALKGGETRQHTIASWLFGDLHYTDLTNE